MLAQAWEKELRMLHGHWVCEPSLTVSLLPCYLVQDNLYGKYKNAVSSFLTCCTNLQFLKSEGCLCKIGKTRGGQHASTFSRGKRRGAQRVVDFNQADMCAQQFANMHNTIEDRLTSLWTIDHIVLCKLHQPSSRAVPFEQDNDELITI